MMAHLQRPALGRVGQAAVAGLVQRLGQLAEHVDLQLLGGGVADAHRRGTLVAGSHGTSHSGSRRSPEMPYMIWICSGLPAMLRCSQSRQDPASS